MSKIGIIYIGIGEYIRLWDDFYTSCESQFCTTADKHYYIVTDSNRAFPDKVDVIHQDNLAWSCNVSFKFLFFLRLKQEIEKYDYVFTFNGNTRFKQVVTEDEVLPSDEEGGLVALTWKDDVEDADNFGFERNKDSVAFIPFGTKAFYLQAGLIGGKPKEFIQLIEECHRLTMKDFCNGIIPISHDESIYNRYMLNRKFKLLSSTYGRPSQWDKKHTAKIIFLRKESVLGHNYLRKYKGRKHTNTWLIKVMRKIGLVK